MKLSNTNFQRLIRLFPNFLWPVKVLLVKAMIKRHGKNFKFGPNVVLYNYKEISVGDNVFIGDGTVIGGNVPVTIGNNVMFGPEVMIRGGDHNFSVVGLPMAKVKSGGINLPVLIEDDVWIGARATILKGVRIGEGSVVGAASVVTKNVPPYTINVGNPSKPLRCRFTLNELYNHLKAVNSKYTSAELKSVYEELNIKIKNG